jgi:signal peptidase I
MRGEHISKEALKAALEMWSQAGETHYLPLHGGSMLPLLHDGDQMLVSHDLSSVRAGDIVVFQREQNLVAHRVMVTVNSSRGRELRTKGDSWLYYDLPISEKQIFGTVLAVRRANRQMRLDTPAWQASGRAVAGVMRMQAWLYTKGHRAGSRLTARIYIFLSRGTLWLGGAFLKLSLILFGRWQPDGETGENTL